ncbi:ABC transporter ATP-binding protein [Jhaorihella thermophila]|uniref:Lipoprotein-releasing system ATP-binding protein n=1 Tax=Jhaorihella thermophila TaxID=488547 RepID=A0A1H5Z0V9_9RHOB|nr:ABC transporter ATP-binding protein [Jhaorihella thermophila]SEG29832.1 lipoprotein-releasing system ATP-binding protein [Jhaorihella thermophila]
MSAPVLEVREVHKVYGEGATATHVLKGVSLAIDRGEMVALIGASGSGKSTLLNILGTLARPTSGQVTMLGEDLTRADDDTLTEFRNRHIGFVFQFHHLLPDFTALENVMFPSAVRAGRERAQARARAAALLAQVGLSERADFRATQLSGGQKQRVAIARALMNGPELILADEPTGNLDRQNAMQVMDLLARINRESGTSFLISTHDEEIAARCGRRVVISDGVIAADKRAAR